MTIAGGRLALVVGHERTAPGALAVAPIAQAEYAFNSALAKSIELIGVSRGHEVLVFYRDGVGVDGAYRAAQETEPDAVIELHFNAFNGQVRGTETLYADESDEKGVMEREFAECIHGAICRALQRNGIHDRGVKSRPWGRGERGARNLSRLVGVPSILVEPFFGDNTEEASLVARQRQQLETSFIEGFEAWRVLFARARGYVTAAESRSLLAQTVMVPNAALRPRNGGLGRPGEGGEGRPNSGGRGRPGSRRGRP